MLIVYQMIIAHSEERSNPGVPRESKYLRPVLSSDVAGLLTDTDADTDTATVNRVETFEFRWGLLELSSPHYVLSGTYRVHMHQS